MLSPRAFGNAEIRQGKVGEVRLLHVARIGKNVLEGEGEELLARLEITQLHDVENARREGVELLQGRFFERRQREVVDAICVVEEGPTGHVLNFILAKNLKASLCPVVVLVFHFVFPGITVLRKRPTR